MGFKIRAHKNSNAYSHKMLKFQFHFMCSVRSYNNQFEQVPVQHLIDIRISGVAIWSIWQTT